MSKVVFGRWMLIGCVSFFFLAGVSHAQEAADERKALIIENKELNND